MDHTSESGTDREYIWFNDVTLRDGEQAPGNKMSIVEKLEIAEQLVRSGFSAIEAGFPINRRDFESVRRVAADVGPMTLAQPSPTSPHPRISGLARLRRDDIERALQAVQEAPHRGVHTFISTSDPQKVKFAEAVKRAGGNPESLADCIQLVVLKGIEELLPEIKNTDPHAVVQFSLEDWTRTEESVSDDVILAAATNGADIINLPDTVGIAIPALVMKRVAHVRELLDSHGFGYVRISWHGHNDTGQAVANAIAAMHGGARQLETTILGIGERTGNTAFEGTLAALDANHGLHEQIVEGMLKDSLVRGETMRTAQMVSRIIKSPIPREFPIVGENAFAHESGIHQDGVLKGERAGQGNVYEVLVPERYGAKRKLILGKHSGISGLRAFIGERSLPCRDQDMQTMAQHISELGEERHKGLSDQEVMREVYYPEIIRQTGGDYVTSAKAREEEGCKAVRLLLRGEGGEIVGKASAPDEGAIDACVQAIRQLMPSVQVTNFQAGMKSSKEGSAAAAVVSVTLADGVAVTIEAEAHDTETAGVLAVQRAFNALWAMHEYTRMHQTEGK